MNTNWYIGEKEQEQENDLKRLKLLMKKYLELDNVSILAGAGTSYHLNAPVIRAIPQAIHDALSSDASVKAEYAQRLKEVASDANQSDMPSLESFINYLQAERFTLAARHQEIGSIDELIRAIQKTLFQLCNTETQSLHKEYVTDERLKKDRYCYHEKFVKKLLQRPVNLRRINLFTTNYDLSFEYAFDRSGIQCINGFSGFTKRCFRPEAYDYDIYYPGQTTAGTVHRADKVIKYYKLHGSLSWVSHDPDP